MKDSFGLIGRIKIFKYDKDKLIQTYEQENLITDIGLDFLLHLIGGDRTGGINKIVIGNNNTPADKTNTSLGNKLLLLDVMKDYSVPGRINFIGNIKENTFNSIVNYQEAGLVYKSSTEEILITRLIFNDVIYQKPENSLSILYSLELKV
jgi:hypothetical protein